MSLKFPKARQRIGKTNFEEIFMDELKEQETNLQLGRYCEEGGWPDPESVELEIENASSDLGQVVVRIGCRFSEVVTTSCADLAFRPSAFGEFDITLVKNDDEADVDYIPAYDVEL
jgi:hypothetical protein